MSGVEVEEDDTIRSGGDRPSLRRWSVLALAALLVVAVVGGGTLWWSNRTDYLPVGSRHRVTVTASGGVLGSCWNNIGDVRIGDQQWTTGAHSPSEWGIGADGIAARDSPVPGWLEVTAKPSPGPTAVFTADVGGSVTFYGGGPPPEFGDLGCAIGPG